MADNSRNDDLWSQLLGAAQTESGKKDEPPVPEAQPESPPADDPWAMLLSAAEAEASRQPAPSAEPESSAFAKGSMLLDTYRVESDPLHGGMGSVWRVHHTGWNTDLAMKRPKPEYFASEDSKQGFIDECKNWIDLGLHPNIVSCYYVREIDGIPSIFSEWMENGDLEHHIRKGTLYDGTEEELQARLLDIAIQYARGLHYAHEQGLIHQDVKPANLLLTNDWQAKAADFGLANARAQLTVLEGDPTQQDAGQSLNAAAGGYTPAYCSMEQMDGKSLTRRTDIYSWAVSVMEMYIGSRPWQNGVVAGAGCRDYMQAQDCRVKMPDALQDLLAKCMEMNADNRPHDFAEVEAELVRIYRDAAGEDYPRPEPEAAPDTADSLNNAALTYLDLGMPEKAEECWEKALQKKPDHLVSVYNQGLYDWRTGHIRYHELLEYCGNADARRDETGLASRWRAAVDAEYKNDYGRIIHLGDDETSPFGHPFAVLSPDRKRVYCGVENRILCWDTDTLEELYCVKETRYPERDYISDFMLTRDGRYLAGVSAEQTAWVADPETGKTLRCLCMNKSAGDGSLRDRKNRIVAVCLHPDSRRMVVLWGYDNLQVFNLETGREERSFSVAGSAVPGWKWALCFSPDGKTLYIGTTAGTLCAMDFESGEYLSVVDLPSEHNIKTIRTSNGGRWLWFYSNRSIIRCPAENLEDYEILAPPGPFYDPFWVNADGTRILAAGYNSNPWIWNPVSGEVVRTFCSSGTSFTLDAADDLSLIVLANGEKALQLWDGRIAPCRAPWELCRARDWKEQNTERQETDRLAKEIDSLIRENRTDDAARLLEDAEGRFDPVIFLPQRKKLSGLCRCGEIIDVNAVTKFDPIRKGLHMLQSDPPSRDGLPSYYCVDSGLLSADPRGGVFVQYYYGDGPTVTLYSETGSLLKQIPLPEEHQDIGSLLYSPSGRVLAAGCRYSVVLIDPDSGSILRTLGDPVHGRFLQYAPPVFSPDGSMLAAGGDGSENRAWGLWSTETGRLIRPLEKPPVQWASSDCAVYAFVDGGKKLICSARGCGSMYIYDAESGRIKNEIQTTSDEVRIIGVTPDSRLLFVDFGPGEPVRVIDTTTWQVAGNLNSPSGDGFHRMCFSPDGTLMAAFSGRVLYILSVPDMEQQQAIPYDVQPGSVRLAFSGDSCLLGLRIFDTIQIMSLRRRLIV